MKPVRFKYVLAKNLEDAVHLKALYGEEARFLAGGQSLIPGMNFRLTQPEVLIDINALDEIAGVHIDQPGGVRIGALTRYRVLERDANVQKHLPLVREALPNIAHPQIRNRGTIGGNLSNADPASELPAIVLTLGGRLTLKSKKGERSLEAAEFFVGALTTAIEPTELLVAIDLPAAKPRAGFCFQEVSRRRGDFAMMGVATAIQLDDNNQCIDARIGLCNAGDGPVFAGKAASSLIGNKIGAAEIREAAALVQDSIDPGGSIHASKEFQRHLATVLTSRTLKIANERARLEH